MILQSWSHKMFENWLIKLGNASAEMKRHVIYYTIAKMYYNTESAICSFWSGDIPFENKIKK